MDVTAFHVAIHEGYWIARPKTSQRELIASRFEHGKLMLGGGHGNHLKPAAHKQITEFRQRSLSTAQPGQHIEIRAGQSFVMVSGF